MERGRSSGNRDDVERLKSRKVEKLELLAIERELKGPGGAAAMEKYDRTLVALGERLEAVLKAGLPPAEYPRAEALREVNVIARKLLRLGLKS